MKDELARIVSEELRAMQLETGAPVQIGAPRDPSHGDFSTNAVLVVAKQAGRAPLDVARELVARLARRDDLHADASVAGPGFINFRMHRGSAGQALCALLARGAAVGASTAGGGERLQIEFVSANPTGPLNVVSARAAAYGSTLARMLTCAGWRCDSEFYVNDAGRQVELLGGSVQARWSELHRGVPAEVPEGGYQGEYVRDLAALVPAADGERWAAQPRAAAWRAFGEFAVTRVLERQRRDLEAFGVRFDRWFRESELYGDERVAATLAALTAAGHVYQADGAQYFRTTHWGDDKDRVVVRSDSTPTYFLADAAYHRDKHARGYARVIDVWGPDHHGHIPRMQAVAQALGYGPAWLEVVIIQWVKLIDSGRAVKMSKRAGQLVTLADLLAEVPADVARYFFLMRHHSSHLDFDLGLALETSEENPVYYVKYAHARICSVIAKAQAAGLDWPADAAVPAAVYDRLVADEETALVRQLVDYPGFVARAAVAREPHRLTGYCEDVARAFHRFYHQHRILQEDRELALARMALAEATRRVLAHALDLMSITAPTSM
jgi:arginyl-tRNA synthetase